MPAASHIFPDLLAGLSLIVLGSTLFTRSLESTVERFFKNRGMGLRLLGNTSLSLPELILPLFAFLAPNAEKTAVDAGTGALFGPPIFLFLFLLPLIFIVEKKSIRPLLFESPLLFIGLLSGLLLMGMGLLPRVLLGILLLGFYLCTLFLFPSEGLDGTSENRTLPGSPNSYRIKDGISVAGGTLLMTLGSHLFLSGIDLMSRQQGSRAFWIALLLTPLATEAPELLTLTHFLRKKSVHQSFSILWGSIHFQLTLSIAAGLVISPWKASSSAFMAGSGILGLLALAFILGTVRRSTGSMRL
jgi:Ca2+/Na+ antiporter